MADRAPDRRSGHFRRRRACFFPSRNLVKRERRQALCPRLFHMSKPLSAVEVARLRLCSLLLDGHVQPSARAVAQWFGAMQSQDLASGKWSFGVRLRQTEAEVDAAIEAGEVLRTWPMRGTLHFVAAEDARWLLETTGRRALAKAASRRLAIGLTEKTAQRAADLLGRGLAGGKRFTRDEVVAYWRKHGIEAEGQQVYHLLGVASQLGVTCVGPNRGKGQTFVLLSEWAPKQLSLGKDESLATLALRYFRSHGPASQQDFMGWSGLAGADVKRGMAALGGELVAADFAGKPLWMTAALRDEGPARLRRSRSLPALALPGFDEYMLGFKDRTIALAAEHQGKIVPGGNGVFQPTMVREGVVVGTWRRTFKKTTVVVEPMPFSALTPASRKAFDAAFSRYASYLGLACEVRWSAQ